MSGANDIYLQLLQGHHSVVVQELEIGFWLLEAGGIRLTGHSRRKLLGEEVVVTLKSSIVHSPSLYFVAQACLLL